ncbi:GyrI-like domain-containing protein [Angustibacter aerolatus]
MLDLKRLPAYTARRGRFDVVQVPPLQHLAVDGRGDPNTSREYADAVTSLYPLAYRLKAIGRQQPERAHVVMPLEALWWSDDLAAFTSARDKGAWSWRLLIAVPDWVTGEHVEAARDAARRSAPPALDRVRLEPFDEGLVVQTLHVGPYDEEGPVIEALHAFAAAQGLRLTGHHHEVYLGDPRRSTPDRLRTILRQPVEPAA